MRFAQAINLLYDIFHLDHWCHLLNENVTLIFTMKDAVR